VSALRGHKYALLLVALLCVAVIESFGHRRVLPPIVSDLVIITALLLVFFIVFEGAAHRLVAFIALTIVAVVLLAQYFLPQHHSEIPLRVIYHSASLLLVGFATFVILRNIFKQRVVGVDDVLGAICGYMLAAGAWANIFLLLEIFIPGSFTVGSGFGVRLDSWEGRVAALTYVSLASLTSVGSGVIEPIQPPATILIPLEALFGQFYLAVVVAQLVGARLSQREASGKEL
jgi:voltage-gated potassium channel